MLGHPLNIKLLIFFGTMSLFILKVVFVVAIPFAIILPSLFTVNATLLVVCVIALFSSKFTLLPVVSITDG